MSPLQCFYKLNSFLHKSGYVSRMELIRLPARALHYHVDGIRSKGSQPKKWINNLKEYIKRIQLKC